LTTSTFQRQLADCFPLHLPRDGNAAPFSGADTGSITHLNEVAEVRLSRQSVPFFGEFLRSLGRTAYGSNLLPEQQDVESVRHGCANSAAGEGFPDIFLAAEKIGAAPPGGVPFSIVLQQKPECEQLLDAARMGWGAVASFVGGLDGSGVQYFTEWCRDLRLSLIWLVSDEKELGALLRSDAPYAGLMVSETVQGTKALRQALRLAALVPKGCSTVCFFDAQSQGFREQLETIGCAAYVDICGGG
jgi:hypothetical protein